MGKGPLGAYRGAYETSRRDCLQRDNNTFRQSEFASTTDRHVFPHELDRQRCDCVEFVALMMFIGQR
jgi:hypothetical protein